MALRIRCIFFPLLIGLMCNFSSAQELTTECWSDDWQKYLEKCYLVVSYRHSWSKANEYCAKYGARLAETAGPTVNNEISRLVTEAGLTDYWNGYNTIGISEDLAYNGFWSDGRRTSVKVGVWGHNQPDPRAGDCTYVKASEEGNFWYTMRCDRALPYVCEMDPCPEGMFQCSERCIAESRVCDGTNDCGDNRDELNCHNLIDDDCTYFHQTATGTIQLETLNNAYKPGANCQWTVETKPGTRINIRFQYFETEDQVDLLELWDGGLTVGTSSIVSRLSGKLTQNQMTFTSSNNFLTFRFVSDASIEKRGFGLSWTTEHACTFRAVSSFTFSNTDKQEGSDKVLGGRQTYEDCQPVCNSSPTCYGFVYFSGPSSCRFFSALPVLEQQEGATIYMKTCPPHTTLEASVPLPETLLTALSEAKQLSTPSYPLSYIGNQALEYTVTTAGNNLITLEVLDVNLCCDDTVEIYDGTSTSGTLLGTLTSTSEPHLILSVSQNVFIKMVLNTHWKCRGVLITYKQGCHNILTETGTLMSPGYGTAMSYPGVMECTWTLKAPSEDRSITIVFEDFGLEQDKDFLMISKANVSNNRYTGTQLMTDNSHTADNYMTLMMKTSALESRTGFKASFSPGCSSLQSDSVVLNSNSSNYLDVVKLSCADGYYFTGDNSGESEIILQCVSGGVWNSSHECARAYCGPAPLIENGFVSATGVQGGDTAAYACDSGFAAEGAMTIKCNADHSWDKAPNCTSGVCPSVLSVTTDVIPKTLYGDGSQYGAVVRLSCADHREIHGAATVKCVNGSWDFVEGQTTICHSKPCPIPLIENAYLTPPQPYVSNQVITVECKSGYKLMGDSNVTNCGTTGDLPRCEIMKCTLDFENIVPVENPDVFVYNYSDRVVVKCADHYELDQTRMTTISLYCLSTGQWSIQPSCSRISCGLPLDVKGAVYNPPSPCLRHGCEFTFSCKDKYELFGTSSLSNTTVRCGVEHDGLWGFNDLRCIGGQCGDPRYPASGYLKTTSPSFQEGSIVEFGCTQTGYELDPPGGLTCRYNETSGSMEWDPPTLPRCVDTTPPEINNCPTSEIKALVSNMQPPGFLEPTATDNTGVKAVEILPRNYENFRPDQPINRAMTLFYMASDFAGHTATCTIRILVSDGVTCENSLSLNYLVQQDEIIDSSVLTSTFTVNKDPRNQVLKFDPEEIQVEKQSSMLQRIDTIQVSAETINGTVVDSCKLQFRYRGYRCNSWGLHVPGGGSLNCIPGSSPTTCNAFCQNGARFMESPDEGIIPLTCTEDGDEGVWSRDPPVCASHSATNVIYTAIFDYKYNIQNGQIGDWTACMAVYKEQLERAYETLVPDLQALCNANSQNNSFTLQGRDITPASLSYNQDSNQLTVRLEVQIDLQDDSVDNVLALKDICTGHIQTALNTNSSAKASILSLDGSNSPVACGTGSYASLSRNEPKYGYTCEGFRKYHMIDGKPACLSCPLGYSFDVATDNCLPCPDGAYGFETTNGPACSDCPRRVGPGKKALTSDEQCSIPGVCKAGSYSDDGLEPCRPCPKNFYSQSEVSQTCYACPTDKVTKGTGSKSEADCLSLDELGTDESVCIPNPCHNNGTCSIKSNNFFCMCAPGYTGRTCITPFNGCTSKPCKNGQPCVPGTNDSFSCQCSAEFEGELCETDTSACLAEYCENNGTCHNQIGGSHLCVCPAAGGFINTDGKCATPNDPCSSNPCDQGTCIEHGSFYRSCACYPGYTGKDCDINIEDCKPESCMNGGDCVDGVNSITCICDPSYHGDDCRFLKACNRSCEDFDTDCNSCVTSNTEVCVNIANSYTCNCKSGFTGTNCEIENSACSTYPCQHGGKCTLTKEDPGYNCTCSEPWEGVNCEKEKTKCPVGDKCYNNRTCYSTNSGFQCDCGGQFRGETCDIEYDHCSQINACLGEGSSCSFTEQDGFKCSCGPDLSGDSCHIPAPTCSSEYCYNGGTCDDSKGILNCTCKTGFEGSRCETNSNDCEPNPCGRNQQCKDGVNAYVCECVNGLRGENCDKDEFFDYIIDAPQECLLNDEIASFSEESGPISQLSVAFWVRFTQLLGLGTIMKIYGSVTEEEILPAMPDFTWRFDASGVTIEVKDTMKRKKRAESSIAYRKVIADGFWHHVALTWMTRQGKPELSLYVDGNYTDQLVESMPSSMRGFIVFGDDAENTFKGRLSRLYVTREVLTDDTARSLYLTPSLVPLQNASLLHQDKNLMQQYMIDYNSEISHGICMPQNDQTCRGLYTAEDLPGVSNCEDVSTVTERAVAPEWTWPTFTNTNPDSALTNRDSGGEKLDWGVYGISFAELDDNGNAAVCAIRLYNSPVGCTGLTSSDASCTVEDGDQRCSASCSGNQQLTGTNSAYQTCSKYSMWGKAVRQEPYNYPTCTDTKPLTYYTTLSLTLSVVNANCEDIKDDYSRDYQGKFNSFDDDFRDAFCGDNDCARILGNTFLCNSDSEGSLNVVFQYLPNKVISNSRTLTPEEALKFAVADASVFTYEQSPGGPSVTPDLTSLEIDTTAACEPGFQRSGDFCVQCGSGTYYNESTATCKRCPIGEYRNIEDAGTTPTSPCNKCFPPGSLTTASDGSLDESYCKTICLQGEFFSEATGTCTKCHVGFYQPEAGKFNCIPCKSDKTTDSTGKTEETDCVLPASITTTSTTTAGPGPPSVGAATGGGGLSTGVIVAVVLGVIIGILIIFLVVCLLCFKCQVPCFAKKTQEVAPEIKEKDRYFASRYGEPEMRFVKHSLTDLREKKGRPLDKEPFVEPPLSEESGSVKNDISIHLPVFMEKLDGSISKKNTFVSNGIYIKSPSQTQRLPLTSSPRANVYHDIDFHDERKHKKKRRKKNKKPTDFDEPLPAQNGQIPKALTPIPQRLRSMPPDVITLRPSSALERPRDKIESTAYEEIIPRGSVQQQSSVERGPGRLSSSERGLRPAAQIRHGDRSLPSPEPETDRYDDQIYMKRIEVESDQEDLR